MILHRTGKTNQMKSLREIPKISGGGFVDAKLATIHLIESFRGLSECPKILDLGMGGGQVGFLLNQFGVNCEISGVEIYADSLTDKVCSNYDNVYIGDISKDLTPEFLQQFDFVVWLDVIEHFEIREAERLANLVVSNSKYSIISTPNYRYKQGPVKGNPFEEHKCYLDYHSMKSLYPIIAHFTLYGCATYLFMKREAEAVFVDSKIKKGKVLEFCKSLGIEESGFYVLIDEIGPSRLILRTDDNPKPTREGIRGWKHLKKSLTS